MAKKTGIAYNEQSFCSAELSSIYQCHQARNIPGLKKRAYVCLKDNASSGKLILTDPEEQSRIDAGNGATPMSYLIVREATGSDSVWNLIEFDSSKSQFTCETQGSGKSKTFKNKLSLVVPGASHTASVGAYRLVNRDVAVVFQDQNSQWRIIGNNNWDTEVTVSQDSGQGEQGESSTTINFECTDKYPAPFFEGILGVYDTPEDVDGGGSSVYCMNGIMPYDPDKDGSNPNLVYGSTDWNEKK